MAAQLSSGARVGVLAGLKEASGFALQASYELPTNDECERAEALSVRINAYCAAVAELVAGAAKASVALNNYRATGKPDYAALTEASDALSAALAPFSEAQS